MVLITFYIVNTIIKEIFDIMKIIFSTKTKYRLDIYGEYNELSKLNKEISSDLGIATSSIKQSTTYCSLRYYTKMARLVAWYLYKKELFDLKNLKRTEFENDFNDEDDEFLYMINALKEGNAINPNVEAKKTLEWCHIIQKQLSYKTQPIFSNKGQTKYYYLHIPN